MQKTKEAAAETDRAFQRSDQGPSLGCDHGCARSRAARRQLSRGPQEPGRCSSQLRPGRSSATRPSFPTGPGRAGRPFHRTRTSKILDNLPEEEEEELTPDTVRPEALVDPLPFLTSGLWEKVHVAQPRAQGEKRDREDRTPAAGYGHDGWRDDGRHDERRGQDGLRRRARYAEMMKRSAWRDMMGGCVAGTWAAG